MARNFFRIFTENNPRYVGQQNLLYSRSEGVKKFFSKVITNVVTSL